MWRVLKILNGCPLSETGRSSRLIEAFSKRYQSSGKRALATWGVPTVGAEYKYSKIELPVVNRVHGHPRYPYSVLPSYW